MKVKPLTIYFLKDYVFKGISEIQEIRSIVAMIEQTDNPLL